MVYRWSDYITDKGYPTKENYAPGTWYTEWLMQESPEQARYTASLSLFYADQESNPFPDTFVFVPAPRWLRFGPLFSCWSSIPKAVFFSSAFRHSEKPDEP